MRKERRRRQKARENGDLTYTDSKGVDHLTSNGKKVFYSNGRIKELGGGKIIADPELQYWNNANDQLIKSAKEKNKKYANLYHFKTPNEFDRGRYTHKTELSTMRKYDLSRSVDGYYKHYMEYDGYLKSVETIKITKEEFDDLGGINPYDENPIEAEKERRRTRKIFDRLA